jgi:hypothetical protein
MRSLRRGTLDNRFRAQGTHSEYVPRSLDMVTGTKDVQHTDNPFHLD